MPDDFDIPLPKRSTIPVEIIKSEPIYPQGLAALGLTGDQMNFLSFNKGWRLWRDREGRFLLRNHRVVSAGFLEAWRVSPNSSFLGDGTDQLLHDLVDEAKFVPRWGEDMEDLGEAVFATGGVYPNSGHVISAPLLDDDMRERIRTVGERSAAAVRLGGPHLNREEYETMSSLKPEDRPGIKVAGRGPLSRGEIEASPVALRFDADKDRYDLIPPEWFAVLAKILGMGAKKYADRNWEKGFKYSQIIGSAFRHIFARLRGEINDPESGLPHLGHAAWNILVMMSHDLRQLGMNDLPDVSAAFERIGK